MTNNETIKELERIESKYMAKKKALNYHGECTPPYKNGYQDACHDFLSDINMLVRKIKNEKT